LQIYANAKKCDMENLRLTSARKAVLELLESTGDHATALQIHAALISRLPSLNLTTVYRSLEYLVEHQLISVSDIGAGSPVYEKISAIPHHHLICQNCESIQQVDHSLIAPFFEFIKVDLGFDVLTNHLVLYGICQDCK
jgi:Fur family ferric uptake transcriptional regulator